MNIIRSQLDANVTICSNTAITFQTCNIQLDIAFSTDNADILQHPIGSNTDTANACSDITSIPYTQTKFCSNHVNFARVHAS
ncbi:hypothetical protein [Methylophaga sp.]|uniref:hypothetical protein n=1 Tax=Methylophaga sp. TaxID=2024840 RepID=UPI0025CE32D4|nr:hypothetical protein [Methylophaga sp.]